MLALAHQWQSGANTGQLKLLITAMLAVTMLTGIAVMMANGGLASARFFGHVMHWLGWLAVLTWIHVLTRQGEQDPPATGLPLLLTASASIAGALAILQDRI